MAPSTSGTGGIQTGRGASSFCTILLDIDHFKMVNDNYGHDVGDQVLRYCVEQLRKCIRESDELGRWGGEEFLILSLDTELAEAVKLAQRLCDELSVTSVVQQNHEISVTASFGVTQYQFGEAIAYCLKRADDVLYAAKVKGRNCMVDAEQD
ncbi:MAG: GGDEF domain-containing protein [Candidatus Thiodiazotropha sp. (ex Lucinoma borealis)]|nr:GGDEF domain-containing protein [Candidatus Thiodiazotropha sp. (ex Lucinoma borealis)]